MTFPSFASAGRAHTARPIILSATTGRGLLAVIVAIAIVAGLGAPDPNAAAQAGADLTRLLRFMAVLKAALAIGALAALFWRLAVPIAFGRFAAYAAASSAMAAGPGLIWGMGHVGLGALLLHGGLIAVVVLLWRDPATVSQIDRHLRWRGRP